MDRDPLREAGTSTTAIRKHYDLPVDFFRLWLGPDLVYSCALWGDPEESLADAQRRKLDHFGSRLVVRDGRVLDIGCGWGALVRRLVGTHGAASAVGLTLSPAQAEFACSLETDGRTSYAVEHWADHQPEAPYDAIACIEATEHFASDRLDPDGKVEVYRAFFERTAEWLRPGGRLGLQLICLDNLGHAGSRAGRGPFADLIMRDIFPDSMPAALSELVTSWESRFELLDFVDHTEHYRATFRAWALAGRASADGLQALVGPSTARTFARYFAAGEVAFRLREHSLHRVVLRRRDQPKVWLAPVRPSLIAPPLERRALPADPTGASMPAVQAHYDVSNEFYRLWLGPTMMYSSGMWAAADDPPDLSAALERKIDFFSSAVLPAGGRVLDVGCGWGGTLRRMARTHGAEGSVGLTLSSAQRDWLVAHPVPGAEIRLEDWADHRPVEPYAAIVSFGAFEHFARDGSSALERIAAYRRFFASCFDWLEPGGRLGLETIALDNAPDTSEPRGRGPLGDAILRLFPESLCPHLSELVHGFEPYFEVEILRSDPADFARTFRVWLVALRDREDEASTLVGRQTTRQFLRYLASSHLQFRTRTITNYRLVLHRRPALRA